MYAQCPNKAPANDLNKGDEKLSSQLVSLMFVSRLIGERIYRSIFYPLSDLLTYIERFRFNACMHVCCDNVYVLIDVASSG